MEPKRVEAVFRRACRVEFADTDASGRIHFTAALCWAEETEHDWLRTLGVSNVENFPRLVVNATFRRALVNGVGFDVELGVDRIGTTSITYKWRGLDRDVVYFDGHHTVVHVDADGAPIPLPEELTHRRPTEFDWKQGKP